MRSGKSLLAVLIDADNIPAKHAEEILKEITTLGEPALRRVYGDWSSPSLAGWKKKVGELGLVANQETANTTGKNASDIGLVIDAMDILHTGRFDGFVIVSSDSDFTSLANRLREDGVTVFGIGESKAPANLRNVCNRFILIENIVSQEITPVTKATQQPKGKNDVVSPKKQPPSKAVPFVLAAMASIDAEGEWFALGGIGSSINRARPDFDPRTYGSTKLSELIEKTGQFETRKSENGALQVRRKTG